MDLEEKEKWLIGSIVNAEKEIKSLLEQRNTIENKLSKSNIEAIKLQAQLELLKEMREE